MPSAARGGGKAIDANVSTRTTICGQVAALFAAVITVLVVSTAPACAGQASTGELLFYPCTSCHPITDAQLKAGRTFPNGFKGHEIVLVGHDALGRGAAACLVCHDAPSKDPGKLKAADGSLVDIKGDVSRVCYRCHSTKFREWKMGTHGRHESKCTAAGCHDPHTPQWIYAPPLMPFVGSGFQFKVVPARWAFTPLMAPPGTPPSETPVWFAALAALCVLVACGIVLALVVGRPKR